MAELTDLPQAQQDLVHNWERRYVEFLNVLLGTRSAGSDYWRWNGHSARLRQCLEDLRAALDLPTVEYGSKAWREQNGVGR